MISGDFGWFWVILGEVWDTGTGWVSKMLGDSLVDSGGSLGESGGSLGDSLGENRVIFGWFFYLVGPVGRGFDYNFFKSNAGPVNRDGDWWYEIRFDLGFLYFL